MAKNNSLPPEEVLKNIQAAVIEIQKDLKLAPTSAERASFVEDSIRTGCLCFDLITGGGLAPGRMSTIFGEEQTGKSLLVTSAMKTALTELNIPVVALAYEPLDPLFIARQGLDMSKYYGKRTKEGRLKQGEVQMLFPYAPDTGEQGLRMMHRMMSNLQAKQTGTPQLLWLFDSFPAALSETVVENDESKQNAVQASMYSKMLPLIESFLSSRRCTMLGVNQLRENPRQMFGSPSYEPCGNAIRYYSSMRAKLLKISKPKDTYDMEKDHPLIDTTKIRAGGLYGEESISGGLDRYIWSSITTTKNKTFSPHRGTYMRIWFEEDGNPGRGIDPVFDTWQYLYETKQLSFVKDSKGKNTDKFVVAIKGFDTYSYTWKEFKEMILLSHVKEIKEKYGLPKDRVLRTECADQIENSSAFVSYFDRNNKRELGVPEESMEGNENVTNN